jgi:hypothetical protein
MLFYKRALVYYELRDTSDWLRLRWRQVQFFSSRTSVYVINKSSSFCNIKD